MYIGGKWLQGHSNEVIDVFNPFSYELIATVPRANIFDVEDAYKSAEYGKVQMKKLTNYERYEIINEIADNLKANLKDIAEIITYEIAKPIKDSLIEVGRTVHVLKGAAELAKNISGEEVPFSGMPECNNKIGFYTREPVGVVLCIIPFNFPISLLAHKIGPALAAGNAVIIKPSIQTSTSTSKFVEQILKSNLPKEAVNLITGEGDDIGVPLISDQRSRMISFTGSKRVGEIIMKNKGLKKCVMELGSNSSVIILKDSNLENAAKRIKIGAFSFAGQLCISVQRVFVEENVYDQFIELMLKEVDSIKVGNPMDDDVLYSSMINKQSLNRIDEWVRTAKDRGAEILAGGKIIQNNIYAPTILTNVPEDHPLHTEEAFAPVVVVEKIRDLDEGIYKVNNSIYGLQTGVYTKNINLAIKAFQGIETAAVFINEIPTFRVDNMPYGGIKASGIGREGMKYALEEMTELKLFGFNY